MQRLRQAVLSFGFAVLSGGIAVGQARLGLHVVDSNDQKIGYVLDASNAIIFVDGIPYGIEAGRVGFKPVAFPMFYTTADCSGTNYVEKDDNSLLDRASYTSDGLLHYPSTASPVVIVIQSTKSVGDDGVPGPCAGTTGAFFAAPVLSVSAPPNTPPFRVVDALQVSPAPLIPSFNDVPTNHPFFQFIEALKASGITGGCQAAPPLYCPDSSVTRGQMAVFLAKALGL
jgi:hypothetical protein